MVNNKYRMYHGSMLDSDGPKGSLAAREKLIELCIMRDYYLRRPMNGRQKRSMSRLQKTQG